MLYPQMKCIVRICHIQKTDPSEKLEVTPTPPHTHTHKHTEESGKKAKDGDSLILKTSTILRQLPLKAFKIKKAFLSPFPVQME